MVDQVEEPDQLRVVAGAMVTALAADAERGLDGDQLGPAADTVRVGT
ncbi:hypothetical protein PWY87_11620 [Kribbella solani]|nr:hypothetical protein [Kribbella solani]MDX3002325.1 hypothetical protein [Kribbella solani]